MVAWTGLSEVFESEKLDDTRSAPTARIVTSSGSTSSCAEALCENTAPTAQRASTVYRTRPLRSALVLSGEREPECCISYGAVRVNTIGNTYVPGALLMLVKSLNQLVRKKTAEAVPLLAAAPEARVASEAVIALNVPFDAVDQARSLIGFTPPLL